MDYLFCACNGLGHLALLGDYPSMIHLGQLFLFDDLPSWATNLLTMPLGQLTILGVYDSLPSGENLFLVWDYYCSWATIGHYPSWVTIPVGAG